MKLAAARFVLIQVLISLPGASAWAKGLDALSDKSPEVEQSANKSPDQDDEKAEATAEKEEGEAEATGVPEHPPVNALTQKLYFATSFGRVSARRAGGSWQASGMSDFSVGYRLLPLTARINFAGTYRYAPVALSGQVNAHSYRGVWETHYLGARADSNVASSVRLVASGELGFLHAALRSTDGLQVESSAAKSGVVLALGGGADYLMLDAGVLGVGPRAYVSFGTATILQLAISCGLTF